MTKDELPEARRSRGVYLLPNLFTTAALFCGFYAIIAALRGRFELAAIAVFIAMILDGLDGRVARMTHTESEFGAQYDSMADLVSFGLAPALIMYEWALGTMADTGPFLSKLGWLAAFFYTVMAALRLARFNVQLGSADKRYFIGLPSPSAAAIVAGLVWFCTDLGLTGPQMLWPALVVTIGAGALMFSNVLYFSFKQFDLHGRMPFMAALLVVLIFVFTSIDPPKILFLGFLLYGLSGPVMYLARLRQRARRRNQGLGEHETK
ncbi:MAG TPA: CDP-diacylglycerol--serine O-phosphatidyltransferase [Candidatus Competibacteraceae bacterium]|nr:CDP-diacylglycerol--serine O-phosphatidyltransferase [Candidatus Competibacteraceae bacterium]MCP5133825.1 CDP-diacylglycerol--serine O-phosphatidyltransferase [Gammaproteobacteria bacterium]HPF59687.1 CDP-diacylglycerol--serine O-phosphatidyltransferase [Candidatus Competibacteraceae bacterium]HRY18358.1 CDP-diacylglycerol--serine O-phosphatidyltransferase [Candidatus Competibacteraceae bacterium]